MAFEGLRSKLRSLADSGSDAARDVATEAPDRVREASGRARQAGGRATGAVARRAPATGLERGQQPSARQEIARRLQSSGQMRKPIGDANLEPGADPRFMEAFGRGDATTRESWFGEGDPPADPMTSYFAQGDDVEGVEPGPFVQEMLDERDHEGGLYAYEDDHERGLLDDGGDLSDFSGVAFRW